MIDRETNKNCTHSASLGKRRRCSRVRCRTLQDVFRTHLQPSKQQPPWFLDSVLARISVLYEDLRIETFGCAAESLPILDVLDPIEQSDGNRISVGRYRRNYFLRRSIATILELIEALNSLMKVSEFIRVVDSLPFEIRQEWNVSLERLNLREDLIRKLRIDVGGHFADKAAAYAVATLSPGAIGTREFARDDSKRLGDVRLRFVGEIVATAMLLHLPETARHEEIIKMIQECAECYKHATRCVQVVVAAVLNERFA
jgi:hypothetical protein